MNTISISSASQQLAAARRVVIKVGSALICGKDGVLRSDWLKTLGDDVAALRDNGLEVLIVTSGSIALGRQRLGLSGALSLDEKQAASAAGQAELASAWQDAFAAHGVHIAQILLTRIDTENRHRYLNARATIRTLLSLGAQPLINENDTVATSEIRYGDNDRLAALAAQITESDTLIILSDVDGLYSADPRRDPSATHIAVVDEVTPAIEKAAEGPNQSAGVGSGGMESKIRAAKLAARNGCASIITAGAIDNPIKALASGARATLVKPIGTPENARRQWIAGRLGGDGVITVDAGAARALRGGASLLAAGITGVSGDFSRGDPVEIADHEGNIIGQGLSSYYAKEIRKIAGRRSEETREILGTRRRPAVIEKNDLVLHGDKDDRRD